MEEIDGLDYAAGAPGRHSYHRVVLSAGGENLEDPFYQGRLAGDVPSALDGHLRLDNLRHKDRLASGRHRELRFPRILPYNPRVEAHIQVGKKIPALVRGRVRLGIYIRFSRNTFGFSS